VKRKQLWRRKTSWTSRKHEWTTKDEFLGKYMCRVTQESHLVPQSQKANSVAKLLLTRRPKSSLGKKPLGVGVSGAGSSPLGGGFWHRVVVSDVGR